MEDEDYQKTKGAIFEKENEDDSFETKRLKKLQFKLADKD